MSENPEFTKKKILSKKKSIFFLLLFSLLLLWLHSDGKKYKVSSSYLVNGGSFYPDQVETHVTTSQPLNHSGNT
jgi:hypothetical protein